MQRIEPLHRVDRVGGKKALAERRHAEIDEAREGAAAEAAVRGAAPDDLGGAGHGIDVWHPRTLSRERSARIAAGQPTNEVASGLVPGAAPPHAGLYSLSRVRVRAL